MLALLLALALLTAAPLALAQGDQSQAQSGDNATEEARNPEESVAFEDEPGQIYATTLLLAVVASGIVIAIVLVKQHWRVKNR